jgi:hypothetical protein
MSRWVDMYPASWRARYGEELEWLLAERPPKAGDALDLARGALDAHLDPQVPGDDVERPWTHRLPGLLAVVGGIVWIIGALRLAGGDLSMAAPGLPFGIALVFMVLSVLGDFLYDHRLALQRAVAVVVVALLSLYIVPWEVWLVPILAILTVVMGGMLALAATRAGFGALARWVGFALWVVIVLGGLGITVTGMTVGDAEGAVIGAATTSLYGIAWAIVGIRLLWRGAPTFEPFDDVDTEASDA